MVCFNPGTALQKLCGHIGLYCNALLRILLGQKLSVGAYGLNLSRTSVGIYLFQINPAAADNAPRICSRSFNPSPVLAGNPHLIV